MDEDRRISYFLLGLGVGVAVGVLFAPKSGTETRELLKSKAEEGKEQARKACAEMGKDYEAEMAKAEKEGGGPPKCSAV